ncbi:MAG TPA: amidohydrolase family protein [Longimicrobiales bacterium]
MRYRLETADGRAVDVDGTRLAAPDGACDIVVELGPVELRAGLINAHDHLHRNHYPRLGAPPYPDAYAWGRDIHARWADEIARCRTLGRGDALLFGALKNLLGAATSVVHHDRWEPAFGGDFPVRVVRLRIAHSLRLEPEAVAAAAGGRGHAPAGLAGRAARARIAGARGGDVPQAAAFCIHLAEGATSAVADEVRELAGRGLLDRGLLAVHVVGADADGVQRLRAAGAGVVWCPTSNRFLFGRTAPAELLAPGIDVLLGSDALLTGDGTLLDELRAARALGILDDARLRDAVGATAARRLGLPAPSLAPGSPADLVALRRPVLEATPADVDLAVVGGVPRLGDERFAELFERAGVATEALRVGGTTKLVARPLGTVARRVLELSPECGRIFA